MRVLIDLTIAELERGGWEFGFEFATHTKSGVKIHTGSGRDGLRFSRLNLEPGYLGRRRLWAAIKKAQAVYYINRLTASEKKEEP